MENNFKLVFDEVILSQLKQLGKNNNLKLILSKMLDKMELLGPRAGELIDSHLFLYEIKSKHPPIRLYYMHTKQSNELYVFEYELKKSQQKQQKTISKLQQKAQTVRSQDLRE